MISKFVKLLAVALLIVSCSKKNDNLSELVINTQEGPVTYYLETALTKDQMAKGLMDRKELRADSGMIFVLQGQEDIAMWMRDTYIPLDMVFISKQGKVIAVYENAEPLSTNLIRPKITEPLGAVIELNGGDIKKNGIKVGDSVKNEYLK